MYQIKHVTEDKDAYLPHLLAAGLDRPAAEDALAGGTLYVLREDGRDGCLAAVGLEETRCVLRAVAVVPGGADKADFAPLMEWVFFRCAQVHETLTAETPEPEPGFFARFGFGRENGVWTRTVRTGCQCGGCGGQNE